MFSQFSILSITVKPSITYEDKLKQDQTIKGGQKLVLDTAIIGVPTPATSWTFNGEPLVTNGNTFLESSSTYSRVTLMEAVVTQSGVYKIVAENEVGSAEAQFNVLVKGKTFFHTCNNN